MLPTHDDRAGSTDPSMESSIDDASTDQGLADEPIAILCPECLAANPESRHFCLRCATPLTAYAAIDPLGRIYATADTYRKAIACPNHRIVIIGMWLLFGPAVLGTLMLAFVMSSSAFESTVANLNVDEFILATVPLLLLFDGVIATTILVRLTSKAVQMRRGEDKVVRGAFPVIGISTNADPRDQAPSSTDRDQTPPNDDAPEDLDAILLTADELRPLDERVRELFEAEPISSGADPNDQHYGQAFRNYLLFAQWPFLIHSLDLELDDDATFYNVYYWFWRYSQLRQTHFGPDTVLEQQAAEMFSRARGKVDPAILKRIDARVDGEMAGVRR